MDETVASSSTSSSQATSVREQGWRPDRCERVAFVFQGGALGAYQAVVCQAMHEAGIEPDRISGVSVGAINAAIIAGNPPERRLQRLNQFWEHITDRKIWPYTLTGTCFVARGTQPARCSRWLGGSRGSSRPTPRTVDEPLWGARGDKLLHREHWQSGYEDTKRTLRRQDWMVIPPPGTGIVVHDVYREHDR